jgi:arginyl-tRNA synthetase
VNTIGGYVNLSCTAGVWLDILNTILCPVIATEEAIHASETTGSLRSSRWQKQKTIVVDYIGANAGKPLHIGHLCTPSVGQAICNIYNHLGYRVIGDSHFGDWGGIFWRLIYAWRNFIDESRFSEYEHELYVLRDERWNGDKTWKFEEWKNNKLSAIGIDFILKLYQTTFIHGIKSSDKTDDEMINKMANSSLESKEKDDAWYLMEFRYLSWIGIDLSNPEELKHHEENVELWKRFTSISITEVEKKLDLLNVHATYNIGESFYEWLGLPRPNNEDYPDLQWNMKDIVKELIEKWVATQNEDGSVGVVFSEESKLPSCILQKKDGTGLYLTSDLAAIKYRLTNGWNPSKIIYSVDVRQQLHLKQAFTIAKMAWPELTEWVEFFHAFNGFIKLREWAMSTRHGTVIFLEKLIEEGEERTRVVLEEKWRTGDNKLSSEDIQAITVGAIKYSYLSQDREKDVTFDWDKALSFEGNSGPYIQYACVRAAKVAKTENIKPKNIDIQNMEFSPYDTALIRTLSEMEGKIQDTASKYKPHTLALYCYDLAVCFNSFYVHTPKILEESDKNLKYLRLNLCRLVSERLTLGFNLLGIKMPSEM